MVTGHDEVGQAHHCWHTPTACDDGGMACHAAAGRHDALGQLHSDLVGRCGLVAYEYSRLATVLRVQDRLGCQAENPTGGTRAGRHTGSQQLKVVSALHSRMQEGFDQRRGYGSNGRPARFSAVGRHGISNQTSKVVRVLHGLSLAHHLGHNRAGRPVAVARQDRQAGNRPAR